MDKEQNFGITLNDASRAHIGTADLGNHSVVLTVNFELALCLGCGLVTDHFNRLNDTGCFSADMPPEPDKE